MCKLKKWKYSVWEWQGHCANQICRIKLHEKAGKSNVETVYSIWIVFYLHVAAPE